MRISIARCDRCGHEEGLEELDRAKWLDMQSTVYNVATGLKFDLCPSCAQELRAWLKGQDVLA